MAERHPRRPAPTAGWRCSPPAPATTSPRPPAPRSTTLAATRAARGRGSRTSASTWGGSRTGYFLNIAGFGFDIAVLEDMRAHHRGSRARALYLGLGAAPAVRLSAASRSTCASRARRRDRARHLMLIVANAQALRRLVPHRPRGAGSPTACSDAISILDASPLAADRAVPCRHQRDARPRGRRRDREQARALHAAPSDQPPRVRDRRRVPCAPRRTELEVLRARRSCADGRTLEAPGVNARPLRGADPDLPGSRPVAGRLSQALWSGPHACTRFGEIEEPRLPGTGGCGSRHAARRDLRQRPGVVTLQREPEHVAVLARSRSCSATRTWRDVIEVGAGVRAVARGDRVAVNPLLAACRAT